MDPLEVQAAKRDLTLKKENLDEAIAVANLRGTQERLLVDRVDALVASVVGVERAWRTLTERKTYELTGAEHEARLCKARLVSTEADLRDKESLIVSLKHTNERLLADYRNALRDGEDRLAMLQTAKQDEVLAWWVLATFGSQAPPIAPTPLSPPPTHDPSAGRTSSQQRCSPGSRQRCPTRAPPP